MIPRFLAYAALLVAGTSSFLSSSAVACTRAVYIGDSGNVVTGRTMDWKTPMDTNLWKYPRGIKREGGAGPNSITWTSKYGSLTTSVFEAATAEGMNEKGLVASLLWLAESKYPTHGDNSTSKPLAVSYWAQYVLDNYATVNEAVEALKKEPFYVVLLQTPDGQDATVHLAITDPSGDSAIFEYLGGKLTIHHSRDYRVMTNSPAFEKQLSIDAYWAQIGGLTMLPGTNRASDRFVRATFYIESLPKKSNKQDSVAGVFSVMRNVSVPLGISTPNQPNIATTLWRSVSDQTNRTYFFDSSERPNVFWVELDKLNFKEGASIQRLIMTDNSTYSGETSSKFKDEKPFEFLHVL